MSSKAFSCIFFAVISVAVATAQLNQAIKDNQSPKHEVEHGQTCNVDHPCAAGKFMICDGTCKCVTGTDSGFDSIIDTEYGEHGVGEGMCMAKEGSYCQPSGYLMCLDDLRCDQVQGQEAGVGKCVKTGGGGGNGASGVFSNILILALGLLTLKVVRNY